MPADPNAIFVESEDALVALLKTQMRATSRAAQELRNEGVEVTESMVKMQVNYTYVGEHNVFDIKGTEQEHGLKRYQKQVNPTVTRNETNTTPKRQSQSVTEQLKSVDETINRVGERTSQRTNGERKDIDQVKHPDTEQVQSSDGTNQVETNKTFKDEDNNTIT
ncbi:MAG: hypothetical protein AAGH89_08835 [Verrucomicrobiota bacterium]